MSGTTETPAPSSDTPPKPAGVECCPNCGAPSGSQVSCCRHCGYYAVLGKCIEIAEWEHDYENGEYVGPSEELKPLLQLIPTWVWSLVFVLFCVTVVTIIGLALTPSESLVRLVLAYAEVAIGLVCLVAAHLVASLYAAKRNLQIKLLDALTSPISVWMETFVDLPSSFRRLGFAVGGCWAILLAHLLLGVSYEGIFVERDWGPEREKAAPVAAGGEDMSMEDAMEEFADNAGASPGNGRRKKKDKDKDKGVAGGEGDEEDSGESLAGSAALNAQQLISEELECLIVGFTSDLEAGVPIDALVIAVRNEGEWVVVGKVANGLTPELRQQLAESTPSLRRQTPFVPCEFQATWLEPVLRCQVQAEYNQDRVLQSTTLLELN